MAALPEDVPTSALAWKPCHRLICSRFPTVGLFAIEALTNPRMRQEVGLLSLVDPADRVSGPGATLVMSAITDLNPALLHDPHSYGASQRFGHALHARGSPALAYDSVRDPGGQCLAVFAPRAVAKPRAAGHLGLHWDGRRITHWFAKGEPAAW